MASTVYEHRSRWEGDEAERPLTSNCRGTMGQMKTSVDADLEGLLQFFPLMGEFTSGISDMDHLWIGGTPDLRVQLWALGPNFLFFLLLMFGGVFKWTWSSAECRMRDRHSDTDKDDMNFNIYHMTSQKTRTHMQLWRGTRKKCCSNLQYCTNTHTDAFD